MSIDYYACDYCGETFSDCGPHVRCECGNIWCDEECAGNDGWCYDNEDDNEDECNEDYSSCGYCRGEKFSDTELLGYAVSKLGCDIETLIEWYKVDKEKEPSLF